MSDKDYQRNRKRITSNVDISINEWLEDTCESKSGKVANILEAWKEWEEEHDVNDMKNEMNLVVLKTYRNAIEKNIQALKAERDRLQNKIDEVEDEENEEVLLEVELDFKEKKL